ncbi:MAG: hypothetical protein F4Y60_08525 [Boseongicola sp. SB0664_bin_43]|uniref:Uncharacterized protein n=1 Tax=Boseongicola sp. SB0664_bin_43 TaxID=2604844 RepID=A0A6B0Y2B0_9RHOB|nr:hypothetical protein [Boseongicola sp. SB0664_bin_43]
MTWSSALRCPPPFAMLPGEQAQLVLGQASCPGAGRRRPGSSGENRHRQDASNAPRKMVRRTLRHAPCDIQQDYVLARAGAIWRAVQAGRAGRRQTFVAATRGPCRGGALRIAGQRHEAPRIGASEREPFELAVPSPSETCRDSSSAMRFGKRHGFPIEPRMAEGTVAGVWTTRWDGFQTGPVHEAAP